VYLHEGDREQHEACEEHIHPVAHGAEHLRCESRDDEVKEPSEVSVMSHMQFAHRLLTSYSLRQKLDPTSESVGCTSPS
jgi:hypothetical protein